MDTLSLLRVYVTQSHNILEATLGEVTPEQSNWQPGGKANSIAANYGHLVSSEDAIMNTMVNGNPPLMATTMAGKTGMSEPPPQGDWREWAERVQIDLPALREYAQVVFANTDTLIAALTPEDLDRSIDLTATGFGQVPLPLFITLLVGGHASMHTGEISCLKGQQGMRGYPI